MERATTTSIDQGRSALSSVGRFRRFAQWFLGGDVLTSATAAPIRATDVTLPHLERARLAVELADRALDDFEPLKSGPGAPLAISLLREAAYWALTAQGPATRAKSLEAAFDAAHRDRLIAAAGDESSVDAVRASLVERTFVETAEVAPKVQEREARRSLAFVRELIGSLEERKPAVTSVAGRRAFFALVGAAGIGLALFVFRPWRPVDLAALKSWRTSTQIACDLTFGYCAGQLVDLAFHTEEENAPWAELDLKRPTRFSSIEIRNREDCCKDRAVPLVVEASDDAASWRELGRRETEFNVWNLKFPFETARYLRFSVPHRTFFHLKSVSVY